MNMAKENNLIIFEGYEVDFLLKNDVNVDFDGDILFNGKQIAEMLGYKPSSKPTRMLRENQKVLIKDSMVLLKHFRKIHNTGETFLTEKGVFALVMNSEVSGAQDFQDLVYDMIIEVKQNGRYDVIEQRLQLIEDETERDLSLGLYAIEQALKANPHDVTLSIMCDNKRLALESYKQSIKLNTLENKTNQIEEKLDKMTVVGDRVEFKREVDSICRATGSQQYEVFSRTYNKLKDMYGVDVVARTKNARDKLQEDRVENGKKPYAESTLQSKINPLDIVEDLNMWKEISKCLSSVRMELVEI